MSYTIVLRPAPGTPDDWTGVAADFGRPIRLHRRMPELRLPVRTPVPILPDLDQPPSPFMDVRTVTAHATGRYEIHDGERAEVFEVAAPAGERPPAPLPMITPEQERELIEHFRADVEARVLSHQERPVTYDDEPSVILDAIRAHMAQRRPRFAVAAEQAEVVAAIAQDAGLPVEVTGVPWLESGTGVLLPPEGEMPTFGEISADPVFSRLASLQDFSVTLTGQVNEAAWDQLFGDVAEPLWTDAAPMDPNPTGCWSCNRLPGLDALDGLCDRCWGRLTGEGGE